MPNSCSLSAQKRDRTKSQLVKSAVKNGPTLRLKFYYLPLHSSGNSTRYKVQGTRYKGHTNIPPPEAEKVSR